MPGRNEVKSTRQPTTKHKRCTVCGVILLAGEQPAGRCFAHIAIQEVASGVSGEE